MTTTGARRPSGEGLETRRRVPRDAPAACGSGEIHVVRFVPGHEPTPPHVGRDQARCARALCRSVFSSGRPGSRSASWAPWCLSAFLAGSPSEGDQPAAPVVARRCAGDRSGLLALVSGARPEVHLGSLKIGLGGLDNFARFTMLGLDVLAAAALLGWTTPLGRSVAGSRQAPRPAAAPPGARRRARRSDRTLHPLPAAAARRGAGAPGGAQGPPPGQHRRSFKELGDEAVEGVFGALANAIRRAREIAEAIEARGGVPTVAPETHPFARHRRLRPGP